jgi:hypothetical protein
MLQHTPRLTGLSMQLPDSPFNKRRLGPNVPKMVLYKGPYMLLFRFLVRAKVRDTGCLDTPLGIAKHLHPACGSSHHAAARACSLCARKQVFQLAGVFAGGALLTGFFSAVSGDAWRTV